MDPANPLETSYLVENRFPEPMKVRINSSETPSHKPNKQVGQPRTWPVNSQYLCSES